jgi:hypothetical protein
LLTAGKVSSALLTRSGNPPERMHSPHTVLVTTGFEEELVDEDDEDADVDELELENWTQKVKNWWDFGADGERMLQ